MVQTSGLVQSARSYEIGRFGVHMKSGWELQVNDWEGLISNWWTLSIENAEIRFFAWPRESAKNKVDQSFEQLNLDFIESLLCSRQSSCAYGHTGYVDELYNATAFLMLLFLSFDWGFLADQSGLGRTTCNVFPSSILSSSLQHKQPWPTRQCTGEDLLPAIWTNAL